MTAAPTLCSRCHAPMFGDFCACAPSPDTNPSITYPSTMTAVILSAVRTLLGRALDLIGEADPEAKFSQLLDARRALRQCLAALDTYKQRITNESKVKP